MSTYTPPKPVPTSNSPRGTTPGADYMTLIRRFSLRPLRDENDYQKAAQILDGLAVRAEGSLSSGEQDYFETLTLLIQAYDEQHADFASEQVAPLEMLKYLMDQAGMRTADVGRILGNRGLASLILNGHRSLSKTHIRKLADYFKVSPALFLSGE